MNETVAQDQLLVGPTAPAGKDAGLLTQGLDAPPAGGLPAAKSTRAQCPLAGHGGQQVCASADTRAAGQAPRTRLPANRPPPQGVGGTRATGGPRSRPRAVAASVRPDSPQRRGASPTGAAAGRGRREARPWTGVRKAKVRPRVRGEQPRLPGAPAGSRPSPHLGRHRQVLCRRLQLQHRVHLPVGQRRRGVGSPIPESQLLPSVPLRRRLRQQQRRLRHRRRPRGPQQRRGGGDPDRQARATSGRAGVSSEAPAAGRGGPESPDPGSAFASMWAGLRSGRTWL